MDTDEHRYGEDNAQEGIEKTEKTNHRDTKTQSQAQPETTLWGELLSSELAFDRGKFL